jgi:alkaline phosphatase
MEFKMKKRLLEKVATVFVIAAICSLLITPAFLMAQKPLDISFYTPPVEAGPLPLSKSSKVENIIIMIGDGMGAAQVDAARIKAVGANGRLHIERMPVTGLVKTYSLNNLVTDSAAAGTALATGFKANNGQISVSAEGKNLRTILEAARDKGFSTGLVVTSTITHATPAAFGSHVGSRSNETDIAPMLLANKINVLLGGGRKYFLPQSTEKSARKDSRDLIAEAQSAGYSFVQTKEELQSAKAPYVLGLFNLDYLTTESPEPSLAEMTSKAIELLNRNKKGFILMVEGSQIDWAGHENDPDKNIRQTLLFDKAVKAAIDFAVPNKKTLVVVTADHETGGMAINNGSLDGTRLEIGWTTKGHSGVKVPLYAFGPRALLFTGVYDNTSIPAFIAGCLKLKRFPE